MHARHLLILATCALAACQSTTGGSAPQSPQDTHARLAGKTLMHDSGSYVEVRSEGSLGGQLPDGQPLSGSWAIEDAQWCRTISAPQKLAGRACQEVGFSGDQVTFARSGSAPITYTIR